MRKPSDSPESRALSRRKFLQRTATGAAVTAGMTLSAPTILGQAAREFKVGLIGCGGRGTGAAGNAKEAAKRNGDKLTIHAVADLFPDKAARPERQFKVPKERVFTGFDAFQKLLELDLDYVILATPPHFRPDAVARIITLSPTSAAWVAQSTTASGCFHVAASRPTTPSSSRGA